MIDATAHRMLWTSSNMALLGRIATEFEATQPFAGRRIGVSLHLEVKTAVLLLALKAGGADIVATGNYGTSQDDVVAYLNDQGVDARGSGSDSLERHLRHVDSVLDSNPDILLDNGADLARRGDRPRPRGPRWHRGDDVGAQPARRRAGAACELPHHRDQRLPPQGARREQARGRPVHLRVVLPAHQPHAAGQAGHGRRLRLVRAWHSAVHESQRVRRDCRRDRRDQGTGSGTRRVPGLRRRHADRRRGCRHHRHGGRRRDRCRRTLRCTRAGSSWRTPATSPPRSTFLHSTQ